MSTVPPEVIRRFPKVELHLHLETSLRLRRLAEREPAVRGHGGELPVIADPTQFRGYDRLRRMRYARRAGRIPDALYTSAHIEAITLELLAEVAAHHVRYVEVRVGGRRGFTLLGARAMLEAMARAGAAARAASGIGAGFIITIVRERGPEEAEQRVREAVAARDCGVVGVDLAGDEQNYPPALFARAMRLAREAGLGITVHAGEFAGPSSIWTAVAHLGARRIGHGVRAVADPALMAYLREQGVTLEICPTSNVRLGLVGSLREHPLPRLLAAGVPVTVNSDDPLLLETDISRELASVAAAFDLGAAEIVRLLAAAAHAAFLPDAERRTLAQQVAAAPEPASLTVPGVRDTMDPDRS